MNELTCDRQSLTTQVNITWQTAELTSGARVQHLEASCAGKTLETVSIQPVNPDNTFLLYSQRALDLDYTSDNFVTAFLASPSTVELRSTVACTGQQKASLQVVEMAGIRVTRGITGPIMGLSLPVPNLASANLASSALLFTHRSSATGTILCDRMVRGELYSPTSLVFSRADGTNCAVPTVDAVAWERIDFGARAVTQQLTGAMAAGVFSTTVPLATVDPSRTLVFAGAQGNSGQGGGEGSFAGNDNPGAMVATYALVGPTQLELTRGNSQGTARWTSYAVQLAP